MTHNTKRLAIGLLLVSGILSAQSKPAPPASTQSEATCRAFVQDFYHWYVKIINSNSQLDGTSLILKYKKSSFDAELLRQLKADLDASTKSKEEVVGLDFDPILNAQDIAYSYKVGKVTLKRDTCSAEIIGDWGKDNSAVKGTGKKALEPDVIPELALRNGAWVFINFHYPNQKDPHDQDIFSVLKSLREERQKNHK